MYFRNTGQEIRKKNYGRFERLTTQGYSISDESVVSALYVVNEDAFGRTYYQKSLGATTIRDPITGQRYQQEEWATKEFIIDNKVQLINKVSADLLVGKNLSVKWGEDEGATGDQDDWLNDLIERNDFLTLLYESAIRASSLGDQFYEVKIEDGKVCIEYVNPYYVDITHTDRKVTSYELAWEKEVVDLPSNTETWLKRKLKNYSGAKKYIYKKTHYAGMMVRELFLEKQESLVPVPIDTLEEYIGVVDDAFSNPNMQAYLDYNPDIKTGVEATGPQTTYVVVEYTGIDTPLIVHWANYRMFSIYGVSDTGMIESLQNALNNRETQINDVLDKHADPAMYGPDSFTDNNGNLTMSGGGGRYFPVGSADQVPGYLVWNSHLDEGSKEIARIYESICQNTETSPALMGMDSGGIESGRALMYKLIRSLAMKTRKQAYMNQAIKDIVEIAQKLQIVWGESDNVIVDQDPQTDWEELPVPNINVQSALPTDDQEVINQVAILVVNNIIDKETALSIVEKYFDEIEPEEVKKRLNAEGKKVEDAENKKMKELFKNAPDDFSNDDDKEDEIDLKKKK